MKIIRDGVIYSGIMTPNEIRQRLGLGFIPELEITYSNRTGANCKNCGAPLQKDGYCEYCRTQY